MNHYHTPLLPSPNPKTQGKPQPTKHTNPSNKERKSLLDMLFEALRIFNMNSHYITPLPHQSASLWQTEDTLLNSAAYQHEDEQKREPITSLSK